jgi:Mrp family chromosome partitioning ATPase
VLSGHVRGVSERDGVISVTLQLDQQYRVLKSEIARALSSTYPGWVKSVRVNMEAPSRVGQSGGADSLDALSSGKKAPQRLARGLRDVKNIIAVHSCKGGVGKSTVAVNLAYSLATMELPAGALVPHLKIGIFDADIYGPSLPTMIQPRDATLRETDEKLLVPVVYEGVKTMSYGYVKTLVRKKHTHGGGNEQKEELKDQSAIMRGPMASGILSQLVTTTDWGELDYLVHHYPSFTFTHSIHILVCYVL